jgi:hypothetical protein
MFIDLDNHEQSPKFSVSVEQDEPGAPARIIVRLGRHCLLLMTAVELRDLATAVAAALSRVPGVGDTFTCEVCSQERSRLDQVLDMGAVQVCADCYRASAN